MDTCVYYHGDNLRYREGRGDWLGTAEYSAGEGAGNGARKRVYKSFKAKGKRDARRQYESWKAELNAAKQTEIETGVNPHSVSAAGVGEYVTSFIDTLEKSHAVEPSTVRGYRSTAKYIAEGFGGDTLSDLTAARVQRWEANLTGRGLSPSTVGKAHRLLKQAIKAAVRAGALPRNPLDDVRPPKRRNVKSGINALDSKGRRTLIAKLDGIGHNPVTMAARISMYTGLRREEICGLQWRDIEFENARLWVRRAIGNGKGGDYVKQPKTDRIRDVALPHSLQTALLEWRDTQRAAFASAGADIKGTSWVIGDPVGFYPPCRLSREWSTYAHAMRVTGTEGRIPTFHDLRHTWATMYLAAGGDVKTAASNLGHANAAMTLNVYASADPAAKRRAAEVTERAMTA